MKSHINCVDLEVWSKFDKRACIKRIAWKYARDFDSDWQRVDAFSHCVTLKRVLLPQIISYSDTKLPVLVVMECKRARVIHVYELTFLLHTSRSTKCRHGVFSFWKLFVSSFQPLCANRWPLTHSSWSGRICSLITKYHVLRSQLNCLNSCLDTDNWKMPQRDIPPWRETSNYRGRWMPNWWKKLEEEKENLALIHSHYRSVVIIFVSN